MLDVGAETDGSAVSERAEPTRNASVAERVDCIVEQIEARTAQHGASGRPTGSGECEEILNLVRQVAKMLNFECVSLPNSGGLVATLQCNEGSDDRGVLAVTHVDFHPLQRRRVHLQYGSDTTHTAEYGVDRCYDNTGGVAILLRVMVSVYEHCAVMQRPLHVAFITGGDAYSEEDRDIDARRITGYGLRLLMDWVQQNYENALPRCAVTVYASVYEPCQRYVELEDRERDMSFHSFHVVGAGYALGNLPVTIDPVGNQLGISISGDDATLNFDNAFLHSFNKSKASYPIASNGRFLTYRVPRCQPPLTDSWDEEMHNLGTRVVRIDAPLLIPDSVTNTFAAVQSVIMRGIQDFLGISACQADTYFRITTPVVLCREIKHNQGSSPFTVYNDAVRDVEAGVVDEIEHDEHSSCSVQ